jgi:tetratricopeptide (TPR) repeat protein
MIRFSKTLFILVYGGMLVCIFLADFSRAQSPSEEAQRHFNRGMAAVEMARVAEDYEIAIVEFQKARSLAPNWPDVSYNLGLIQEKAGHFGDAAQSLRQYLKLAPTDPDAAAVRALADKLEFKAEQILSDDDILEIFASITDTSKWRLKGVRNANLFPESKWITSIQRAGSALWITYPSGTCGAALVPPDPTHYIQEIFRPNGKTLDFRTLYCMCSESVQSDLCPMVFTYHLEVVSRQKITMSLKYWCADIAGMKGSTDSAAFEFVRR